MCTSSLSYSLSTSSTYRFAKLLAEWHTVAIDALCVHIKSDQQINIILPVATEMRSLNRKWSSELDCVEADIHILCREISLRAVEIFEDTDDCKCLLTDGAEVFHRVGRHKKQILQFGDEDTSCTVSHTHIKGCPSDTELSCYTISF